RFAGGAGIPFERREQPGIARQPSPSLPGITPARAERRQEQSRQPMGRKTRIVILGGGMGALTTAYYLTSKPGWEQEYEITLYQLGWRLGGKCTSSRNPENGCRIEEHGLHVW